MSNGMRGQIVFVNLIGNILACGTFLIAFCLPAGAIEPSHETVEELGALLYHDRNLSMNRTQSCATCHAPDHGFVDMRDNGAGAGVSRAVSLGDDGVSLGDRNAPSIGYVGFIPAFHKAETGRYRGGFFLDGRAATLEEQAVTPLLNPAEMGMLEKRAVVERVRENQGYVAAFRKHYGEAVFDDTDTAYDALVASIAAFERSDFFRPFDSRYDRFLAGEATLTPEEERGRLLFFAEGLTNCALCHRLRNGPAELEETFSNYEYHNVGAPVNKAVRKANGGGDVRADLGLLANAGVDDPAEAGKIKVPTLRNVAVTGPYMHNGVLNDLRTTVLFYNRYLTDDPAYQINPETGVAWGEPEFTHSLSRAELETGLPLSEKDIDALVAFLKTLTDARFEHLLNE